MRYLLFGVVCAVAITGCEKARESKPEAAQPAPAAAPRLVIDVRTPEEFSSGHVKGALNIPHTEIGDQIAKHAESKDQEIILYCRSGGRAGIALDALKGLGYAKVVNYGGYTDAKARLE